MAAGLNEALCFCCACLLPALLLSNVSNAGDHGTPTGRPPFGCPHLKDPIGRLEI
ncbi:hypothetical protein T11_13322 [Trichinella zimbabwensis]|uniref:Uncharacterized protein n=1 Tax=Trichinella zimbabwensis TaxID=268475 RepID=A0A0V1H0B4_9BILA|nr:hypothetical protein T11_13322 [Trichinella zimbabwensis]